MNRLFTNQSKYNLGQVESMCEIFKNNIDLALAVKLESLNYFVVLISKHGQYMEFLNIFEVLLASSLISSNFEINNKILHCLIPLSDQKFEPINVLLCLF